MLLEFKIFINNSLTIIFSKCIFRCHIPKGVQIRKILTKFRYLEEGISFFTIRKKEDTLSSTSESTYAITSKNQTCVKICLIGLLITVEQVLRKYLIWSISSSSIVVVVANPIIVLLWKWYKLFFLIPCVTTSLLGITFKIPSFIVTISNPMGYNTLIKMRHLFILGTYQTSLKILVDSSWVFN